MKWNGEFKKIPTRSGRHNKRTSTVAWPKIHLSRQPGELTYYQKNKWLRYLMFLSEMYSGTIKFRCFYDKIKQQQCMIKGETSYPCNGDIYQGGGWGVVVFSDRFSSEVVYITWYLIDCSDHMFICTRASIWFHVQTLVLHTILFSIMIACYR